jgi:uncharacterized protein (TIGR00730 family)
VNEEDRWHLGAQHDGLACIRGGAAERRPRQRGGGQGDRRRLWEAVDTLTCLRPARHERYRVAIFGSARARPGTFVYEEVKRAAAALTGMGCDIVTGGGPGLMQAANEGAASAGGGQRSMGIRVELPFEQKANPFVEQVFRHKTFFSRLHHFVIASDAFVVAPGGIGTVLETLMIWQLLQVRHVEDVPLILVGPMWRDLVEWAGMSMLSDADLRMADRKDLDIPRCLDSADEAIALLREEHARWRERQALPPADRSGPEEPGHERRVSQVEPPLIRAGAHTLRLPRRYAGPYE